VGLFAATAAALRGHDVTVLERRHGDGDKACGEGLMPTAVRALAGIGVDPEGQRFSGIRYVDASGRHQVRASLRAGDGRGVRRTTLIGALRARAREVGVEMCCASADDVRDGAEGVTVTAASGEWRGDVLLGCDGLGSTVRHAVGQDASVLALPRFGLVAHFAVEPWSTDVEVYWGRLGEAYVTPVASGLVGVALLGGRGDSFAERLQELPALRARLDGQLPVGRVLGAGPLRRRAAAPACGRVALVGDAAGYVDALTGEGLSVGFRSALAAVAAAERGQLSQYPEAWRRITRAPTVLTEVLLRSTRQAPVRRVLVPSAEALPPVFGRVVSWLQ